MDMVRQKAVTKKQDLLEFAIVNELLPIPFAVEIVLKNLLTIVASTNQMVNGTGIFDTDSRDEEVRRYQIAIGRAAPQRIQERLLKKTGN